MGNDTFILTDEIISSGRKSIQKLVDNLICLKIDEIETYDFPKDQVFGLEIIYENALFYLIIRFSSKNKNFLCLAPSRFPRDKCDSNGDIINPPYFSRMKWVNSFDESVIVFADPMIFRNDNINVGWMIGEKNNWYIETFSIIIEKLAKNQNVMEDNILFFGSSAGGFMSICLATILKKIPCFN